MGYKPESVLNKMTKVVRVNLTQDTAQVFTEPPHQYFMAAYYCSPWWDLWGAPLPLVAENKSAPCMNSESSRVWLPLPKQLRRLLNTLRHKPERFHGLQQKCDYVCENSSASVVLPLHSGGKKRGRCINIARGLIGFLDGGLINLWLIGTNTRKQTSLL